MENKIQKQEPIVLNEENKKWILCETTNKRDGTVARKYKVLPMELAKYIKENLNYIFVRGAASEQALTYVYACLLYTSDAADEL